MDTLHKASPALTAEMADTFLTDIQAVDKQLASRIITPAVQNIIAGLYQRASQGTSDQDKALARATQWVNRALFNNSNPQVAAPPPKEDNNEEENKKRRAAYNQQQNQQMGAHFESIIQDARSQIGKTVDGLLKKETNLTPLERRALRGDVLDRIDRRLRKDDTFRSSLNGYIDHVMSNQFHPQTLKQLSRFMMKQTKKHIAPALRRELKDQIGEDTNLVRTGNEQRRVSHGAPSRRGTNKTPSNAATLSDRELMDNLAPVN